MENIHNAFVMVMFSRKIFKVLVVTIRYSLINSRVTLDIREIHDYNVPDLVFVQIS